jgi:hypothetical protein
MMSHCHKFPPAKWTYLSSSTPQAAKETDSQGGHPWVGVCVTWFTSTSSMYGKITSRIYNTFDCLPCYQCTNPLSIYCAYWSENHNRSCEICLNYINMGCVNGFLFRVPNFASYFNSEKSKDIKDHLFTKWIGP